MKKWGVMIVVCLIAIAFYSWNHGLGIGIGAAWGGMNLYYIKQLFYNLLIPKEKNYFKILLFVLIKFPLLYLAGYGLLLIPYISPWNFLIGFTGILVIGVIYQKIILSKHQSCLTETHNL